MVLRAGWRRFRQFYLVAERLRRGWEVHPLYVRSGFIWEKAELHWLRRLLRALRGRVFGR